MMLTGLLTHFVSNIYILILKLANVTPLAICEYKEELYEMMRVQSLHDYRLRAESVGEKGDAAVKDIILAAGLLGSIGGFRSIGSYGEAKRREKLRTTTLVVNGDVLSFLLRSVTYLVVAFGVLLVIDDISGLCQILFGMSIGDYLLWTGVPTLSSLNYFKSGPW